MADEIYVPQIAVERDSSTPLYMQVAQPIAEAITSKRLEPGTRIEDEVSMAHRLQISRPTARQALQRLVDQGLVVRQRGAGTRVAPTLIHRPVELTSLHHDLVKSGHEATTTILDYQEIDASGEQAERLGLPEGAAITSIKRLRLADGEPIAFMTNLVPRSFAPSTDELEQGGLYEGMRHRGAQLVSAHQSIGARNATTEQARWLGVKRGAALVTMRRVTADHTGRIVEFADHVYRGDRYTFDSTVFTS